MAPSVNAKPELQAWHRAANLADPWQKAAGSFLFLRIWGFEGLLPPRSPYTESIVVNLKVSDFPSRALRLSKGREASQLWRHHWMWLTGPTGKLAENPPSPHGAKNLGCFQRLRPLLCPSLDGPGYHNMGVTMWVICKDPCSPVPHPSCPSFGSKSWRQSNVGHLAGEEGTTSGLGCELVHGRGTALHALARALACVPERVPSMVKSRHALDHIGFLFPPCLKSILL